MPVFEFGEWLPDQPALNNAGVVEATNVVPGAHGYLPFRALNTSTNALTSRPRGAISVDDTALNHYSFAGDAGKLYEALDLTWTDRSRAGGYSTGTEEAWEFVKWKNKVLATNFSDDPQQITLGGTAFSDLTTAFKARHIARVRDFVVFANHNDPSDGLTPDRVRWSAIDDETDYTVSPTTLSDFQDLKTGAIQRIFGGEFGVIFLRDAIWRMTFTGDVLTVFQFDETIPGLGLIAPRAAVQLGAFIFILSEKGFFRITNGTDFAPIGANKVDQFVLKDLDEDFLHRVTAAIDPERVYWAYPGAGHSGGRPNRVVVFDRAMERWSVLEVETEMLFDAAGTGFTLEGLDAVSSSIDDLPFSLDSRAWKGSGVRELAGFGKNFKSGFFEGATLPATIRTPEMELIPGGQTMLNSFRHVIQGGTVTARIGKRDSQGASIEFGPPLTERASHRFARRTNARYHSIRFKVVGDWTSALGWQIEGTDFRRAGLRGKAA